MPSYQYECISCKTAAEKSRGIMEEEPQYLCDTCNSPLARVYAGSSPSISFNGSGFYSTDKVK